MGLNSQTGDVEEGGNASSAGVGASNSTASNSQSAPVVTPSISQAHGFQQQR